METNTKTHLHYFRTFKALQEFLEYQIKNEVDILTVKVVGDQFLVGMRVDKKSTLGKLIVSHTTKNMKEREKKEKVQADAIAKAEKKEVDRQEKEDKK